MAYSGFQVTGMIKINGGKQLIPKITRRASKTNELRLRRDKWSREWVLYKNSKILFKHDDKQQC